jgi:putative oxidoreductase
MKKFALVVRLLLGLLFVVFGANYWLEFIPVPEMTGAVADFNRALAATGYMWPLIKGTEVAGGLMLLTGVFVPLGLLLLAPVVVNIALFSFFLQSDGVPMAIGIVVAMLVVAAAYKQSFDGLFRVG